MSNLQIDYDYRSAPTLQRFARSTAFIRGAMGPFGSGKSSGCTVQLIRDGHAVLPMSDGIRRSRFAVIRNTFRQLNETTLKTVMDWLPENRFGVYTGHDHTYRIMAFKGLEIELIFTALDRPDQANNLLSLELTGAWVNEAREVPWEIIKPLMGRVSRFPGPGKVGPGSYFGIIMDTNPPDNDSWWYKLFETDAYSKLAGLWQRKYFEKTGIMREFREIFKQPGGLTPNAENLQFLESGYYELLAADPDTSWVNVHVHAQYGFLKAGKPVFEEYRDELHCRPLEVQPGLILRGWDFGLTPAVVFAQVTPRGQLRLIDELCATRAGADGFSDDVLAYCATNYPKHKFRDIGDPAGDVGSQAKIEVSCFSILRGKGIDIEGGIQTLPIRLESVRWGLSTLIDGEPALLIDPKCVITRKGYQGGYCYKRKAVSGEARYHDEPDKNKFSHPVDGSEYLAAELWGEHIQDQRGEYDKLKSGGPQTVADDDFDLFSGQLADTADDSFDLYRG